MQLTAHQTARPVSLARAAASGWSSLTPLTGQAGSTHR
jgi:hypothetical protein